MRTSKTFHASSTRFRNLENCNGYVVPEYLRCEVKLERLPVTKTLRFLDNSGVICKTNSVVLRRPSTSRVYSNDAKLNGSQAAQVVLDRIDLRSSDRKRSPLHNLNGLNKEATVEKKTTQILNNGKRCHSMESSSNQRKTDVPRTKSRYKLTSDSTTWADRWSAMNRHEKRLFKRYQLKQVVVSVPKLPF